MKKLTGWPLAIATALVTGVTTSMIVVGDSVPLGVRAAVGGVAAALGVLGVVPQLRD